MRLEAAVSDLLSSSDSRIRVIGFELAAELGCLIELPNMLEAFRDAQPQVREAAWRAACAVTGLDVAADAPDWRLYLYEHADLWY